MKGRNYIREVYQILQSLISRVIFYPFTLVVPRTNNIILVIGREQGKFLDNAKYFFIYGERELVEKKIVYCTKYVDVYK